MSGWIARSVWMFAFLALVAGGVPPAAAAEEGFPVTVENCGRTLTFQEPPSRVITGTHPNLETVLELGIDDTHIIGRLHHDEADGFMPGHKEIYDRIPEISGETSGLPPKEELLAVGADLVVTLGYFDFDPEFGNATIEELGAAGTQAYIMGDRCSEQEAAEYEIADFLDDVRDLGTIFGVADRADELIAAYEARLVEVEERVDGLAPVRVVAASPTPEAFSVLGAGLFNEISRRAGGVNVYAQADAYAEVNLEEVAAADIQAFVTFGRADQSPQARRALVEDAAPNSEGVLEERIMDVPIHYLSPGPRQVQLVLDVARLLHPDALRGQS